jgi:hypothetical protein
MGSYELFVWAGFGSTRDGMQDLMFARQALYYLSHAPSHFAFSLFFREDLELLPGWPQTEELLEYLLVLFLNFVY